MSRRKVGLLAVAALALVLSACGGSLSNAGAAANVGGTPISNQELTSTVDAVQQQKGEAVAAPDAALTQEILRRLIITDIVQRAAAEKGVSVPQGNVAAAIDDAKKNLGGDDGLAAAFLGNNVPREEIETQVRLSLVIDALGKAMMPDADSQTQSQAVFDYVVKYAEQLGVDVSPRYGTWIPDKLQVGPVPSDLSTPMTAEDLTALPAE